MLPKARMHSIRMTAAMTTRASKTILILRIQAFKNFRKDSTSRRSGGFPAVQVSTCDSHVLRCD